MSTLLKVVAVAATFMITPLAQTIDAIGETTMGFVINAAGVKATEV